MKDTKDTKKFLIGSIPQLLSPSTLILAGSPSPMSCPQSNQARPNPLPEIAGIVGLVGLVVFYLAISWRKWCDPLIDFGDQLYTAWRLSEGAVLYRDVDVLYGPLSQYFNAALFRIFGPGIMVLVAANLVVVGAIIALLYLLCRHAWDWFAAFVACAVFISIFAFSQYVHFGNLNYVTPYSHEATHGVLVSLALVLILIRWIENARPLETFLAGGLFGLTTLLKPEFMLATGLITVTAGLIRLRQQRYSISRVAILWMLGAIVPIASFAIYFARWMPWSAAISAAGHGWLNALSPTYTFDVLQKGFLGFDSPLQHLLEHVSATTLACLVIAALVLTGWVSDKVAPISARLLIAVIAAAVFASLSLFVPWISVGRCLLGLMSIYAVVSILPIRRSNDNQNCRSQSARLILALLAIAMMARMPLNGRIYQYGFYQAALAGVFLPAIIVGEISNWFGLSRRGHSFVVIFFLALLLPGMVKLTKRSANAFHRKTLAVGSGRDQFYAFDSAVDPTGEMVRELSDLLSNREGSSLLVLPEGEMINYLARLPNPLRQFFFYAGVTSDGRASAIVDELRSRPPYWVVIISRDLGEYRIERYGEKPESGKEILDWIDQNYKHVARFGGDPLDYREHGALLLRKY